MWLSSDQLVSLCLSSYLAEFNDNVCFVFQSLVSLASSSDMQWSMAPSGRKTATPASVLVAKSFVPGYVTPSVSEAVRPWMLLMWVWRRSVVVDSYLTWSLLLCRCGVAPGPVRSAPKAAAAAPWANSAWPSRRSSASKSPAPAWESAGPASLRRHPPNASLAPLTKTTAVPTSYSHSTRTSCQR